MLHLIMLIIFFIQFLVVLGALIIVMFFARSIVPLSGYGPQESPAPEEVVQVSLRAPEGEAPPSGKNASGSLVPHALASRFS